MSLETDTHIPQQTSLPAKARDPEPRFRGRGAVRAAIARDASAPHCAWGLDTGYISAGVSL